jgi:hypothetical protein
MSDDRKERAVTHEEKLSLFEEPNEQHKEKDIT